MYRHTLKLATVDLCFPSLRTETPPPRRTGRQSTVIPFTLHIEKSEWDLVYPGSHTTLMTLLPSLSPTQPGAHLMCTPFYTTTNTGNK